MSVDSVETYYIQTKVNDETFVLQNVILFKAVD